MTPPRYRQVTTSSHKYGLVHARTGREPSPTYSLDCNFGGFR